MSTNALSCAGRNSACTGQQQAHCESSDAAQSCESCLQAAGYGLITQQHMDGQGMRCTHHMALASNTYSYLDTRTPSVSRARAIRPGMSNTALEHNICNYRGTLLEASLKTVAMSTACSGPAHPMLRAEQAVQDLGDGEGQRRRQSHEPAHKPGTVCADLQPIASAQRLWNDLSCSSTPGTLNERQAWSQSQCMLQSRKRPDAGANSICTVFVQQQMHVSTEHESQAKVRAADLGRAGQICCRQASRTKHQHCRDTDDDGRDRVHQAVQEYGQSLPREA